MADFTFCVGTNGKSLGGAIVMAGAMFWPEADWNGNVCFGSEFGLISGTSS